MSTSSDSTGFEPNQLIANELKLPPRGVAAVVELLGQGNTVPFIARYRKEVTGGLDEVQIRAIEERRTYLLELHERRRAVLTSIEEQGKLTDELRRTIEACTTKAELEDLYLPYKPKRRTRATIARERGLEPLAERILAQPADGDPRAEAERFVAPERDVPDADAALQGARDIVAEVMSERADVRAEARRVFLEEGAVVAQAAPGQAEQRSKFEAYYDYREPVRAIPSHRYLAIRRGEREEVLRAGVEVEADRLIAWIERAMALQPASRFAPQLAEAIRDGYKRLLAPSVESEVRIELKLRADRGAVEVFADNLRNLLMAAPLGGRPVIGIDPGLRTGCKCAAVDATGMYLEHITIYLVKGDEAELQAKKALLELLNKYPPQAIAVGNGTGGRETEAFVRALLEEHGIDGIMVVPVSESGASVYTPRTWPARSSPDSTSPSAAPSPSPGACRIPWPSWSRSTRRPSASASTSTTSTSRCWPRSWTRWWRAASTGSEWS